MPTKDEMFPSFKRLILLYSFLLFATALTLASASASASVQTKQIILEDLLTEDLDPALLEGIVRGSGDDILVEEDKRRSHFWRALRYYISYGALLANRVPCPPWFGRSYL